MTSPALPPGWTQVALAEVAESALGKMLDRAKHTTGKRLAYLRNINVRWGAFDLTDLQEMFFEGDELERYGLKAGDVIICEGGEPGRCAVWDGHPSDMKFQKALHRVRPRNALLPAWLALQLQFDAGRGALAAHFTGTTIKHLTGTALASYQLLVPPRAEQQRIVARVVDLSARSRRAKESLDAVPALLDKLRQSILAAAFRGDLTADWRAKNPDVEPADKLLARIRAERRARWEAAELAKLTARGKPNDEKWKEKYKEPVAYSRDEAGHVPTAWALATVELAGDVLLGRRRAAEEYIEGVEGRVLRPYVRVANVKRDRLSLNDLLSMPFSPQEIELYRLQPGDIVLSEGQSPELVGQSGIFEGGHEDLCIQATVHRFRSYDFATTSSFAQLVFLSHLHTGVFRQAASQTTNIAHLTSERLKPLPFPLPPLAEQALIVNRARAALAQIERVSELLTRMVQRSIALESSILAKAFRGELVPQDPNDEPASVLLERIRAARASEAPAPRTRGRRASTAASPSASPNARPAPAAPTWTPPVPAAPLQAAAEAGPTYRSTSAASDALAPDTLATHAVAALWRHGPLDKDAAIRRVAEHLRAAGLVSFQRLRADGPLYAQLAAALDAAVKAGHLDRPRRGAVRACKPDPTAYTTDDWRHALLAVLGPAPTDRDDAVRAAAEWARDHCGLAFTRLRADGHIATGLRSAINSAIRRGDVTRHGPDQLSLATTPPPRGQLSFADLSPDEAPP